MIFRIRNLVPVALAGALAITPSAAQQPIPLLPPPGGAAAQQPPPVADPEGVDVLARGPVHEAYASSVEPPQAGPVAPKMPPEPIEELPPDQKPEGDNVQWIPGYWQWDEERTDFLWVSGFWRVPPPNRVWLPGSWREVPGQQWQWVSGFWQELVPQQPVQPDIEYLPPPPTTQEAGPSVPAPTVTSLYVPGSWMWRGRYVWRPGFWIEHRPNWVWVPAHYRWTPVGCVFIDGYWDYPLASRGVLFAPVYYSRRVYLQPQYVYTPTYVVSEPCMVGALFVRRGHGGYYFGDYFEARYSNAGYTAWCGTVGRNGGFAIGVNVGRQYHYDPLWSYYSVNHRTTPAWHTSVNELYVGRYRGDIVRPARTLVQQNTVINNVTNVRNVTNVTNNVTVVNNNITVNNTNVTNVAMLAPLRVASQIQPSANIRPISADVRRSEAVAARQIRDVAVERKKIETAVVDRGQPVKLQTDAPRTLKLDVSKTAVSRAQVLDEKKAPPPPAIKPNREFVNPGVVGKLEPKSGTGTGVPPKLEVPPKTGTGVPPKLEMPPKVDPKNPPKLELPPKIDPKNPPKVEMPPKVDPKNPPKVELPPKVDPKNPPKLELPPKIDPKSPPKLELPPKVDPKNPPKVEVPPKSGTGMPPKLEVPPKVVDPKGPPKLELPPKLDPKNPPKLELPPKTGTGVPPKIELPPRVEVKPPPKVEMPPKVDPKSPTGTAPPPKAKDKDKPKTEPKNEKPAGE